MQEADCLATCVSMVIEYLGQPMAYDDLLRLLGTGPYGTVTRHVSRLTRLGFSVVYREGTLTELRTWIDQRSPVIILVRTGELPYWSYTTLHAIVLVGYDEAHFYANDPFFPQAPVTISIGDLDLAWLEMGNRYVLITLEAH
jgi:ABC-type bacteriocin/lantibiotic exporter with double-glycine peptidase domain